MIGTVFPSPAAALGPMPTGASGHIDYKAVVASAAVPCASLQGQVLDSESTIERAELVAANGTTPQHCATLVHTKETLHIAIDLPTGWNRRNYVLGNGGFGLGAVTTPSARAQRDAILAMNFAVAANDDGEPQANIANPDYGRFLLTNPEGLVDYSYRAVHLSALYVKQVAALYFGQNAAETYFVGCSDGGREGLIEAQRFPDDFNGIVAGAPVLADSDLQIQNTWNFFHAYLGAPFTLAQLGTITSAVLAACGEKLNGVADGIVADPRACRFNAEKALPVCTTPTATCFTKAQIAAYEEIITGPISRGQPYFPGNPVGSEGNWVGALVPATPGGFTAQGELGGNWVKYALGYKTGARFDPATFDYNVDPYIDDNLAPIHHLADASNTDLRAFAERGGKLVSYVGWADPLVGPWSLVGYYESVSERLSLPKTLGFYRMFALPGVAHCGGGTGPDTIDPFSALVDWVEGGFAPDTLVASKLDSNGNVLFQRLLCRYPNAAHFIAGANPKSASSWRCAPGLTGVPLKGYPLRDPFDARYHELTP